MKKMIIFRCALAAMMMYILALSCEKMEAPGLVAEDRIDTAAPVYHFSIPASMGESGTKAVSFDNSGATPTSTSTFSTTEKVYVYNKTNSTMLTGYLSPSNLSNNDKICDLTGDLTGTIAENDELWLLYNAESDGRIYYTSQNGLATAVIDGAKAVVTVSATDPALTTSDAHFTNLQSMFRFKFEDENSNPISVASLTIFNTNNAVCRSYYGTDGGSELGKIYVTPSSATSDYLYVGIRFYSAAHDGNKMVFIASDGTNLYRARKAEPNGGFENGKYYYNTNPIQLTNEGALQEPTINWTTPSSPVALYNSDYYGLNVDNAEISVTGTSFGYRFLLTDYDTPATIHLNNLTATRFEEDFIKSYYNSVTLDITGMNSIRCIDTDQCVSASQNLKLQGNGTLTVTSNNASSCGLYGGSNYNSSNNSYTTTTVLDVSTQLAADGYRVVRSVRTDNQDGTYTWTYTVALASEYPASVNLNNVTQTDANSKKYYAARDGQTLTGNFDGSEGYITIADGATVTLNIGNFRAPDYCDHAAIHCLGDANIILAGGMNARVFAGGGSYYPAVFVPENKTLTISGTGELIADARNSYGAGIGGGYVYDYGNSIFQPINCGNIVIAGGVISAYGSSESAGIGSSSYGSCGNITISGGVIKEAKYEGSGVSHGAGIGSGSFGSCGTITISGGQIGGDIGGHDYAGAVAGQNASSIGSGNNGSCGTITIGASITFVMVSGNNNSQNLIGGHLSNPCDVYFGNLKVYDKTARKWYDRSTGNYNAGSLNVGNYGGLKFENGGGWWTLKPVTP